MSLSWKPVRRGRTFCSPACGRGCTLAEHKTASRQADALAARLGRGWRPFVWENLGWHFRAEREYLQVYVYPQHRKATAFLSVGENHWCVTRETPEQAVIGVLSDLQEAATRLTSAANLLIRGDRKTDPL